MPESEARWISVRVTPDQHSVGAREACMTALFAVGAQGVHEDLSALVTHFPPGTDLEAVHRAITEADDLAVIETAPVPDIDWSEAWKSRIGSHQLGDLMVTPPWLAEGQDPARTIIIEPGMAFGTGEHATTRGVVRLMPRRLRSGSTVADLGAGSAVLAIAAAKLGAARVYAIELDGEAIPDAEANVERNGVADRVHVFEGDAGSLLPLVAPVHLVLANIISSVLTELLPVIGMALSEDGSAILSGILYEERSMMVEVLTAHGWTILEEDAEDIWWSVSIARA
ncbi:MAG TPA: methyltransferase domain-containing protein [Gemmatimonas aurantiaca]|uniref:Ribosomal protein L11 methyltransferase n=2 Tax=Gemmatimonas aurantiaca TaxID=173480 RepID=C1A4B4_GEMAT|nr:50S ribosomal protein L11 methyltransferase [Gemmatimonas aurantiaca]BAH38939.1 ribosomal protein L11 methyltransferase [Gemmatimonas aurantiaca T-27]HCT57175.1 methyltransferase domain-containing protein [Gemmatimonas aurantiaca]